MNAQALHTYARLSGFLYLAVMASFIAPYVITSGIVVSGDFALSAEKVAASETLYRLALTIQLLGCAAIVLLSGALHALLRTVSPFFALVALAWRLGEALLLSFVVALRFAALGNYLQAADGAGATDHESMHLVLSSGAGAASYAAFAFLALGSIAYFHLLYRSRFIPRVLSGFGILACLAMLALVGAYLVFPAHASSIGLTGMAPMFFAEVAIGLWMLIKGANLRHWRPVAEAQP